MVTGRTDAEPIVLDLDPAKTTISFILGDVLHTVHGTFRANPGSIQIDLGARRVTGTISVDANSGDSGSAARDKRMKRDILEVELYPEITFAPTGLEGLATLGTTANAKLSGWLTIHGQRHALTFPIQTARTQDRVSADGDFRVPYVEWGMKNPSTFLLRVSDTVNVHVHAVGQIK